MRAAHRRNDADPFFDNDPKFSLIEPVRVKKRLGRIFGIDADVMTRDSLHPMLKERIAALAVRVLRMASERSERRGRSGLTATSRR